MGPNYFFLGGFRPLFCFVLFWKSPCHIGTNLAVFLFFDKAHFISSVYTFTLLVDFTEERHIYKPQNLSHTISLFCLFYLLTIIYLFFRAHLVNVFGPICFGFFGPTFEAHYSYPFRKTKS